MKLLWCPSCHDVLRLYPGPWRRCQCGRSAGRYDAAGIEGSYSGEAVPLGIVNDSFAAAIRNRPDSGRGERFTAFVIPREAPRVRILKGWAA